MLSGARNIKPYQAVSFLTSLYHCFCAQSDNKGYLVSKKKMSTSAEMLCRYAPSAFRLFAEAVVNLKFDEEPKYETLMKLFEPLCGPVPSRPIIVEGAVNVGPPPGGAARGALVGCWFYSCFSFWLCQHRKLLFAELHHRCFL